jgi:uncharacterized membrane protein
VLAIVFGLATAFLWATTLLASARASRLLGAWSTLAWVMLIGLVVTVPFVLATAPSVTLTSRDLTLMAIAGVSNSVGLLCNYAAVQRGKVALVGPIISTEGAIAAVLAVMAGDPLGGGRGRGSRPHRGRGRAGLDRTVGRRSRAGAGSGFRGPTARSVA